MHTLISNQFKTNCSIYEEKMELIDIYILKDHRSRWSDGRVSIRKDVKDGVKVG